MVDLFHAWVWHATRKLGLPGTEILGIEELGLCCTVPCLPAVSLLGNTLSSSFEAVLYVPFSPTFLSVARLRLTGQLS